MLETNLPGKQRLSSHTPSQCWKFLRVTSMGKTDRRVSGESSHQGRNSCAPTSCSNVGWAHRQDHITGMHSIMYAMKPCGIEQMRSVPLELGIQRMSCCWEGLLQGPCSCRADSGALSCWGADTVTCQSLHHTFASSAMPTSRANKPSTQVTTVIWSEVHACNAVEAQVSPWAASVHTKCQWHAC